ncbi:unannotated protein [freshwater metagenome]|uniref:Unannotated protein n=1 Tax=freshwater metagenome TaxID=449393 RepID=A0A6J7KB47_9ZZZZ|nr:hypothetical protein [Actinomycetota bacterium]
MKFILFVIDDQLEKAPANEMADIDAFNDRLEADGHWIMAAGIYDPSRATLFDNRSGAGLSQAGAFAKADEHISGFWIIQADSREKAEELAAAGSKACNRKVELRPFIG